MKILPSPRYCIFCLTGVPSHGKRQPVAENAMAARSCGMVSVHTSSRRLQSGAMITRIEQPKGWHSSNLYDVPPVNGVYVLRDQNQNILFIGSVGSRHLRDRLIGHLQVNDVPGVRYFEWYQTDGSRSAREKARQWIARYRPPFVHRRRRVAEAAPILG